MSCQNSLLLKSTSRALRYLAALSLLGIAAAVADQAPQPQRESVAAPHEMKVTVEMIGPVTQTTDLQIIGVLKHHEGADQYIEAMQDFNDRQGKLLSNLRERGEFEGELGETLAFTPAPGTITPQRVLLIGVGEDKDLTLERLELVGRIAAREALRMGAKHVSFAPTLRDQGSARIDVGAGDAAVVRAFILAYDTEKRLQAQHLAPEATVSELVIEAGPRYFAGAVEKVRSAVQEVTKDLGKRTSSPYSSAGK